MDRYALCGQQAGDDAETKAVADVGEDDHGHGDEVEVGGQVEGEEASVAQSRKHSNREEGEADYDCCGEEDSLPAVLVKEVEGADGTEDFCETGDPGRMSR